MSAGLPPADSLNHQNADLGIPSPSDHERADRPEQYAQGSAGNMCIWPSTTIPVSPIPKSCRTKNVGLACAFSSTLQRLALLSKPRRQGRARHDRQRLKLPIPSLRQGAAPAQNQASAHQALHARQSASSRPYARASTAPPNNAPPNCPSGCTATIGIALMAVSAPSHQSAGSAYPGTTC